MNITYRQLKEFLETLTPEQLAMNVSVYTGDLDETFPVFGTCFNTDEEMGEELDTLDPGHPILLF